MALTASELVLKDWQFSDELQFTSNGTGPFSWTAGAFYFRAKGGYDPAKVDLPTLVQNFTSDQRTRSYAGYGQGTYKLDPMTSLTLGFRYSWETRDLNASGSNFIRATSITVPTAPIAGKLKSKTPTWRIALDRHLTSNTLAYASYNRGFKSGGFNAATFAGAPERFLPETLDAFETGLKTDLFDRHLRVNGAIFYYDYKNIQLTSFPNGQVAISNAASAKIYGLDADVEARPIDRLTLTAGLSLLHSRFGTYNTAQITIPNAPPGIGNRIISGSATGNELPNTPVWTLNLGLDYVAPLSTGSVRFSTQYFHSDGWYALPDNRLKQRPYDLVNATIAWTIDRAERFTVSAWGKNLGNTAYANTLQANTTADVIVPAPGRTFGGTLGYKF